MFDSARQGQVASEMAQQLLEAKQYATAMIQKSTVYQDYFQESFDFIEGFLSSQHLSYIIINEEDIRILSYKNITSTADAYQAAFANLKARMVLLKSTLLHSKLAVKFNHVEIDIKVFVDSAKKMQNQRELMSPLEFEKINIIDTLNSCITQLSRLHSLMTDEFVSEFRKIQDTKHKKIVVGIKQQYNPFLKQCHEEYLEHFESYNQANQALKQLESKKQNTATMLKKQRQALEVHQSELLPLLELMSGIHVSIKNHYDIHGEERQQIQNIQSQIEQLKSKNVILDQDISGLVRPCRSNAELLESLMQNEYNDAKDAHDEFKSANMMLAALKAKSKSQFSYQSEYQKAKRLKREAQQKYKKCHHKYAEYEKGLEDLQRELHDTAQDLMKTIEQNNVAIHQLERELFALDEISHYTLIFYLERDLQEMEEYYQNKKNWINQQRTQFTTVELTREIENLSQQCELTKRNMEASKREFKNAEIKKLRVEQECETKVSAVSVVSISMSDDEAIDFLKKKLNIATRTINKHLLSIYEYMEKTYWQHDKANPIYIHLKAKVECLKPLTNSAELKESRC